MTGVLPAVRLCGDREGSYVSASRAEVLVYGGWCDPVPPVSKEQGQATGSGEKEVQAVSDSFFEYLAYGVAQGLGVGHGLPRTCYGLVVGAFGGHEGEQVAYWE